MLISILIMFNVYRMLFLALKKAQIVKITPHQIPATQYKISTIANFAIALTRK